MKVCAAALVIVGLCGAPHASGADERWTPDDGKCGYRENTGAIASCVMAREKMWDGRLNQAWKAVNVPPGTDPGDIKRAALLKAAQRAWLRYRDANCAYYGAAEGTIAQIEYANCLLDMTQARAIELQESGPH